MYYSENFDAKLFLSRVHKDTTASDLESGAVTLKTDLRGRTQQKKQLVKENFDCFVSCKSTIDGMPYYLFTHYDHQLYYLHISCFSLIL